MRSGKWSRGVARGDRGNQFGWRAHEALQGWTASVDAKASIGLLVEVAVAGAAVRSLLTVNDELSQAVGVHLALVILTLAGLAVSVSCALGVVFPRLARWPRKENERGLLFFGHLRNRDVKSIERGLASMDVVEERRQLAEQLQVMSRIAWRKHAWLQTSIIMLVLGSAGLLLNLTVYPDGDTTPMGTSSHQKLVSRGR